MTKTSATQQPLTSTVSRSWVSIDFVLTTEDQLERDEPKTYRSVNSLWPEWHSRANCLGEDESLFFGASSPDERPAYTLSSIRKAREKCYACPVFEQCLRQSIYNREAYGVWAATTMKERNKIFHLLAKTPVTEEEIIQAILKAAPRE